MKKRLVIFGVGLGVIGSLFAASGVCLVAPGEVVVVRRFGRRLDPSWGPGLHWHLPLGIDRLDRVRSDAVRQFTVGEAGPPRVDQDPSEGEALTGDWNLVRIQATIQYRVASPIDFVVKAEQVEGLLIRTTEGSISRALASRSIDSVLRSDRRRIADEVHADVQRAADRLSLGVTILGVSLTDARPPLEVAADFAAAQSAESLRDRRVNEAKTYEAVQLPAATAHAHAVRETAHSVAERTVLRAGRLWTIPRTTRRGRPFARIDDQTALYPIAPVAPRRRPAKAGPACRRCAGLDRDRTWRRTPSQEHASTAIRRAIRGPTEPGRALIVGRPSRIGASSRRNRRQVLS